VKPLLLVIVALLILAVFLILFLKKPFKEIFWDFVNQIL